MLRRDPLVATIDNDCHYVRNEYPVIKAVCARFSAPDALWLDTEHAAAGRRFHDDASGVRPTGGNVWLDGALSDRMSRYLQRDGRAALVAALRGTHDLTESIRRESWHQPMRDSASVRAWLVRPLLRGSAQPSPTLVSL